MKLQNVKNSYVKRLSILSPRILTLYVSYFYFGNQRRFGIFSYCNVFFMYTFMFKNASILP